MSYRSYMSYRVVFQSANQPISRRRQPPPSAAPPPRPPAKPPTFPRSPSPKSRTASTTSRQTDRVSSLSQKATTSKRSKKRPENERKTRKSHTTTSSVMIPSLGTRATYPKSQPSSNQAKTSEHTNTQPRTSFHSRNAHVSPCGKTITRPQAWEADQRRSPGSSHPSSSKVVSTLQSFHNVIKTSEAFTHSRL